MSIAVHLGGGHAVIWRQWAHQYWGFPRTARTRGNEQRVHEMVLQDKLVTVKGMSLKLGTGEASACRISKQLG
jgi:hypothetical protein